jgi:hypothetical protein
MRPTEKLGVADCAADAQLRATSYRRFYSRITKAMNKSSLLITLSTFPGQRCFQLAIYLCIEWISGKCI